MGVLGQARFGNGRRTAQASLVPVGINAAERDAAVWATLTEHAAVARIGHRDTAHLLTLRGRELAACAAQALARVEAMETVGARGVRIDRL